MTVVLSLTEGLDAPYGYQSGNSMDDVNSQEGRSNSYAGGMSLQGEVIVITGSTYDPLAFGSNPFESAAGASTTTGDNAMTTTSKSDCFLAFLELPTLTQSPDIAVEYKERLGAPHLPEACQAVVANPDEEKMYVVGTSVPGGLLTDIRQVGSTAAEMYGTVLDFQVSQDTKLKGGRLLRGAKGANYPVGQVLNQNDDSLYVAYALTESKALNAWDSNAPPYLNVGTQSQPNYIEYRPVGRSGISVEIQKLVPTNAPLDPNKLKKTLDVDWTQEYASMDNLLDVTPTALIQPNDEVLVFAGYTKGFGPAIGGLEQPQDDSSYNGFVTKVDAKSGTVLGSMRIASPENKDDFVAGMCYDGDGNVYVTGYTKGGIVANGFEPIIDDKEGIVGYTAFIQSIELDTMTANWSRQIAVDIHEVGTIYHPPDIMGVACEVVEDVVAEEQKAYPLVYMAGNIGPYATLNNGNPKPGGYDIFIAQFDTNDGGEVFLKEFGSSMDDILAPRNGLAVDNEGNAIILGNTRGSFQRQKTDEQGGFSDIFLMSIGREDGKIKVAVDQSGGSSPPSVDEGPTIPAPTEPAPTPPPPTPTQPAPTPTQPPPTQPPPTPTQSPPTPTLSPPTPTLSPPTNLRPVPSPPLEEPMNPPPSPQSLNSQNQSNSGEAGNGGAAAIVIVLLAILFIFGCFAYKRLMYSSIKLDDDTDPISDYLSAFDFGDVEIKHSATGGYHAIYTNPELAGDAVGPNAELAGGERYPYRSEPYAEEVRFDEPPGPGGNVQQPYRDDISSHGDDMSSKSSRSVSVQDVAIVQDSLFMDDYDTPQLGTDGTNEGSGGGSQASSTMMRDGQASTYDGLLDAYNSTWDELNPHKLPDSSMGGPPPPNQNSGGGGGGGGNVPTGKLLDNDAWGKEII